MVQPISATYTFVFARKGISPKTGKGLLQLRVYLNREKMKYISTGTYLEQSEWDQIQAAIIDSKKERKLSEYLLKKLREVKKFRQDLEEYETGLIHQGKALTVELLNENLNKDRPQSFNEFCQKQLDADKTLKSSTKRPHQNTINKLNEYKARIEFSQVNYSLIEGFNNFLCEQKLNLNTIQGHHIRLGKYIKTAIHKNMIEKSPYANFKVRGEEIEREFLLMEEIEQIEAMDYSEDLRYDRIKDLFLFSCYCGLRFSDLMDLKPEHLIFTDKGIAIKKKQVKVNSTVYLPLYTLFSGKGERIIQKYLKEGQESLFQPISNQKANENLKYIQHEAKISKNLTMHTARHTFGTQIAARTEDQYLISKLLGHRDIKSSEIYVHMAKEIVNRKLEKIEW